MARVVRGERMAKLLGATLVGGAGAAGATHWPKEPRKSGRARVRDRACLSGIAFVLKTVIQ